VREPFQGCQFTRFHGERSGGGVQENNTDVNPADRGIGFVDETKELGLARNRCGKFFSQFPKESIPEQASPRRARGLGRRGVDGIDVAADADGARSGEPGLGAASAIAGPST